MTSKSGNWKKSAIRETALFLVLLLAGLVILPIMIYVTGRALFGEYGGSGFGDFYQSLQGEFRAGKPIVWLLMLSPYIAWQLLRLTICSFRHAGKSQHEIRP